MSSKPGTQNGPGWWMSTSILWPIGPCRQTGANRLSVRQVLIKRTGKGKRELFSILVWWEEHSHKAGVWQSPMTYVGTWYAYGFRIFKDMWKPEVLRCAYINLTHTEKGRLSPGARFIPWGATSKHCLTSPLPTDSSWSPVEGGAFTCTSRGINHPQISSQD